MGIDESSSTPYLVMEYVEGQPLERMLDKGSIPFPRACAWVADVATALGVAHRKGIIHGDVKPANILVSDEGRIKLTDFGMARLASRDLKDTPLLGTPAYWCPEQILGKPQDARSDIFSLGVVLYEMITGHRPFDADSLQGICARIMSSTPLPPVADESVAAGGPQRIGVVVPGEGSGAAPQLRGGSCGRSCIPSRAARCRTQVVAPQSSSFRNRATRLLRSA